MRQFSPSDLAPRELEALRRVSAAGASRACAAISDLSGLSLAPSAHVIHTRRLHDVAALLGGMEAAVVALHLRFGEDFRGDMLITLDPGSARRLLGALVPGPPSSDERIGGVEELSELERSGLLEVGNILAGAYLNVLSRLIGRSFLPAVPRMAVDMAGAILDDLLVEITRGHDTALIIQTDLIDTFQDVRGRILLLPDPATLPGLLKALRQRQAARPSAGV